ncbi:recombinase family protein [Streptomyces sp. ITFR-6]|uniref:recombinase family protein n=1 Tax=Streptomyces sp. ITFR-6 TaxID=3075197 RepID=UPI00288A8BA1|nr:recombinase family protein [Streptomyces sp. ITFR-6]WNI31378.1 recombinase family protein [Streptomyces sp. ITFR-6]
MSHPRKPKTVITAGEHASIYCRISHTQDDDQTGVDRQERICREIAERLQLRVDPEHVYIDNNRSAWKRNRKRPGWDRMLISMAEGETRHVIVYHPDRLMRQPKDLEELLSIADERRIMLHGEANRRNLSDPDDRFILRIEVAHACRSSDDSSRRLKDMWIDHASEGKPHFGNRPYGYTKNGREINEDEAKIVREVYLRYLDGESPSAIAKDLYARKIPTSKGKKWQAENVRHLLSSRYVAAIRSHHGEEVAVGTWPAIIDRGQWNEVQERRTHRAARISKNRKNSDRYYLLRGVATCACGARMAGSNSARYAYYRCTRAKIHGEGKCDRSISAGPLESFMRDVAIAALSELDTSGCTVATSRSDADIRADELDQRKLKELNQMWLDDDAFTATEYKDMRAEIMKRIKERQLQAVQRPIKLLDGIAGPAAEENWKALERANDHHRMNAIYQFLFSAVIIHPPNRKGGPVFDTDRVETRPNPLG